MSYFPISRFFWIDFDFFSDDFATPGGVWYVDHAGIQHSQAALVNVAAVGHPVHIPGRGHLEQARVSRSQGQRFAQVSHEHMLNDLDPYNYIKIVFLLRMLLRMQFRYF
jgi:hypothetical protein